MTLRRKDDFPTDKIAKKDALKEGGAG